MSATSRAAVLLVVAVLLGRLAATGAHTMYVRAGMQIPILAAAALLGVAAAVALWRGLDGAHEPPAAWAGWLLLVPALGLVLIAPQPLGAAAVGEEPARGATAAALADIEPLDGDGPADLGLGRLVYHAASPQQDDLRDREVTTVGFATSDGDDEAWQLARFQMACCAADAFPLTIEVRGQPQPAEDTWVEVTGTVDVDALADPDDLEFDDVPLATVPLEVSELQPVEAPDPPYEY